VLPEEQFEADAVSIRCSQAATKSVCNIRVRAFLV